MATWPSVRRSRFWYLTLNDVIEKNYTPWPWPTFWRSTLYETLIYLTLFELAKCEGQFLQISIFAIEWQHSKIVFGDRDLLLEGQIYEMLISLKWWRKETWNVNIYETASASAWENRWDDFSRFWHLPSKDNIAKIVLHDLDLLFQCQIFQMLMSRK